MSRRPDFRKEMGISCALICIMLSLLLSAFQARSSEQGCYSATYGRGGTAITVATGSPGSLGLLKAMAEPFCRANNCRIRWVKKGSGASLKALREGKVDLAMVHAPSAEEEAVREGWATMKTLLGSNEFYIVGPKADPAGIRKAVSAREAYAMIAKAQAKFFSRGDNSGTHKKEMAIWKSAGIKPAGPWYVVTGDFMGPTLMRADRESGYFMTDSSTFITKKAGLMNLVSLFKGDPCLVNVYHALVISPHRSTRASHTLAAGFVAFMASPEGQKMIREFGRDSYGMALYNDAEHAQKRDK